MFSNFGLTLPNIDQLVQSAKEYEVKITPKEGHSLNKQDLGQYIEDSLSEIDSDLYEYSLNITDFEHQLDPQEVRDLHITGIPPQRANFRLETHDQEAIDTIISNLEEPGSDYEFTSRLKRKYYFIP